MKMKEKKGNEREHGISIDQQFVQVEKVRRDRTEVFLPVSEIKF